MDIQEDGISRDSLFYRILTLVRMQLLTASTCGGRSVGSPAVRPLIELEILGKKRRATRE